MDVASMITVINNHGFEDIDSTQKLADINDATYDFYQREPWPFLVKSANLNFDGTNPYPSNMPTDFKAVDWLTDLTTNESLMPERLSTIRSRYQAATTVDNPFVFYFVGTQLRVYPVPPASTGRFLLDYYARHTPVTDTSLESAFLAPPAYHRIIVSGALARLYVMDDEPELAATKQQEVEARIENAKADMFRMQYVRGDRIYTLDEDEYDTWLLP